MNRAYVRTILGLLFTVSLSALQRVPHELHFGIYDRESLQEVKAKFTHQKIKPFQIPNLDQGESAYAISGREIPGLIVVHFLNRKTYLQALAQKDPVLNDYKLFKSELAASKRLKLDQVLEVSSLTWIPSNDIKLAGLIDEYGSPSTKGRSTTYSPFVGWDCGVTAFLEETSGSEASWKVKRIDYQFVPNPKEPLDDPVDELLADLVAQGVIPKLAN